MYTHEHTYTTVHDSSKYVVMCSLRIQLETPAVAAYVAGLAAAM